MLVGSVAQVARILASIAHCFIKWWILDQTDAQRAEKKFLETTPIPYLRGLDDRDPPYVKVWICHCYHAAIKYFFYFHHFFTC